MDYLKIKRLLDASTAVIISIAILPILILISILIKLDSPGPVLFKQRRYGKDKNIFSILKFRTMRTDSPADAPTHTLENPGFWITRVGRFLRLTSLDELPQLFNVIKGDMSLVGPRPALWNQSDLIEERDKYGANSIPVGITGWAQVNGRDELPISLKAQLDGEYKKNLSFKFDLVCILKTISSVLFSKGVSEGKK